MNCEVSEQQCSDLFFYYARVAEFATRDHNYPISEVVELEGASSSPVEL